MTDYILFAPRYRNNVDRLLLECNKYFSYITREGEELSFLNLRIIQNSYSISIDQSNHITKNI